MEIRQFADELLVRVGEVQHREALHAAAQHPLDLARQRSGFAVGGGCDQLVVSAVSINISRTADRPLVQVVGVSRFEQQIGVIHVERRRGSDGGVGCDIIEPKRIR